MAESDYSTPSWGSISTNPGAQGSELAAPLLSAHAIPFPQPFTPLSYEAPYGSGVNSPPMSQFSDASTVPFGNQAPLGRSPYPLDGSQQMYYPSSRMYPYLPTHPRPPPAFRNGSNYARTDPSGLPEAGDMYSRTEHPLLRGPQPFFPSFPIGYEAPLSPPTGPSTYSRRQHYSMMGLNTPPRYFGQDPGRAPNGGTLDPPRHTQSAGRRAPPQEPYQPSSRPHDTAERRSSLFLATQGRRSDRSVSPRTSNRRSFDRYSFDLSQSSTSSDAEEAAARAPPSNRMRHRPREVRPRFMGHHQQFDPNIATPRQIQELKDKLPRRLPCELSEETSKCCDICQKDYSTTHVKPIEDEEVAVELACGHVFGEFCIFQWFDTCKTHKNKVSCPMCRKLLIEPSRYHPALLNAISRGGQAFQELLANELRGDFAHM
ncbi:Nn.00g094410.m01.CDS01 [Neocucurbitaria sp. VM-36]